MAGLTSGDFVSGTVLTIDGARDNWFGGWPPSFATTDGGDPLTAARRTTAGESAKEATPGPKELINKMSVCPMCRSSTHATMP